MRVLALLHLYPPTHNAGAEWMVHTMLRALVDAGHDVDVQLSQRHEQIREPYELNGVRVWPIRDAKSDPFRFLHDADLVVTHLENTPRATVLGDLNRVPVCQVLHNTYIPSKRWLARGPVALVVYNSQWMRADVEEWLTDNRHPLPASVIVRPPVLAADYRTAPGDRVTLVNLYRPKGSDLFWRLAAAMPDVGFLGVRGAYGDQDIRAADNVDVVDHIPGGRMRDEVYSRTRILLAPSDYESWGRVGVEAMCSGIPVIAHPTPGLRESLGDAGIFVDRDDIDGWVAAIRSLRKVTTWRAVSKRALARAAQLEPTADLATWVEAVEQVTSRSAAVRRLAAAR